MSKKMTIENALVDLEAGKFSFRVVDCVKNHIETQGNELEVIRDLHQQAVRDVLLRDYEIFRLEKELKSVNAKLHLALRTSVILEKSLQASKAGFLKLKEVAKLCVTQAGVVSKPQLGKLYEALKVCFHQAAEASKPQLRRLRAAIEDYRKQINNLVDKAAAQVSKMSKTSA